MSIANAYASALPSHCVLAMHGRTDGLTYVKLVTLREEALDLRFRDTPKNRPLSATQTPAAAALRARLEATT